MRRGKNGFSRKVKKSEEAPVSAKATENKSAKITGNGISTEPYDEGYLSTNKGYQPKPLRLTKNGKRKGRPPGSKSTRYRKRSKREKAKVGAARFIDSAELKVQTKAVNGKENIEADVKINGNGHLDTETGEWVDKKGNGQINVPEVEVEDYFADFDRMKEFEDERKVNMEGHHTRPRFEKKMLQQVTMLAMLGATNEQIAIFFGKANPTIDNWIKKYPEFREARQRGGLEADMKVAHSAFMRANGFHYEEEELKYVNKQWLKFKVKKYSIPDTSAQQFWLKNRRREEWTDTRKVEHKGSVSHEHKRADQLDVSQLSEDSQKLLFEITNKQLTDGTRSN